MTQRGLSVVCQLARDGDVVKLVPLLSAHPAVVNDTSGLLTPLHFALLFGQEDVVRVLLHCGANPNMRSSGLTPLCRVLVNRSKFRDPSTVLAMVLDAGADISASVTCDDPRTVLQYAQSQEMNGLLPILEQYMTKQKLR
jgi:ankyrin repeat protein